MLREKRVKNSLSITKIVMHNCIYLQVSKMILKYSHAHVKFTRYVKKSNSIVTKMKKIRALVLVFVLDPDEEKKKICKVE